MEEITALFWESAEKRRCCRIQLHGEPIPRTVHPYGICRTSANKIVLVCWQALGFTKPGGKEGFRNLILEDVTEVEMLETHFKLSEEFNPKDTQYKEWVFHI
jgi:hypothetical protein